MDCLVGEGDPAGHLLDFEIVCQKRKRAGLVVARLDFGFGIVDGATVQAGWSTGFEAGHAEVQTSKRRTDPSRRALAGTATLGFGFAGMHQGRQERAGGQDYRWGVVLDVALHCNAGNFFSCRIASVLRFFGRGFFSQ